MHISENKQKLKARHERYCGRYEIARTLLNDSLAKFKSSPTLKIEFLCERGHVFAEESNFIQAGRDYGEAFLLADKNKLNSLKTKVAFYQARLLYNQKDFNNALAKLDDILIKKLEHEDETNALTIGLRGEICCIMKAFDNSLSMHENSLRIFKKINNIEGIADQTSNIGRVYYNKHDLQKAESYFSESLEIFKILNYQYQIAIQINNLAAVEFKRFAFTSDKLYLDKAIDKFRQALEIHVRIGNYKSASNVQECIAHIYHYSFNNLSKAEFWYDQTIDSINIVRGKIAGTFQQQENYFADVFEVFQKAIQVCIDNYKNCCRRDLIEKIFRLSEQAKAFVLLSKVKNPLIGHIPFETTDTRAQLQKIKKQISDLEIKLSLMTVECSAKEETLSSIITLRRELAEIEFANILKLNSISYLNPASLPPLATVQRLLGNQTIISFYIAFDDIICFKLNKNKAHMYILGSRENFYKLMEKFAINVIDETFYIDEIYVATLFPLFDFLTKGGKLLSRRYEKILPLLMLLFKRQKWLNKMIQKLVISPDAELHQLPFSGMPRRPNALPPEFLLNNYIVEYTPSVSFKLSEKANRDSICQNEFFCFFNPDNDQQTTNMNFKDHFKLIRKTFDSVADNQFKLFEKKDCTTNTFIEATLDPIKCLHIVAHAYLNSDDYNGLVIDKITEPFIVLNNSDPMQDNRFLKASKIFKLNMNIRLVTLTNCSSGTGSVIRGEGINSLARAFLAAGVECVVASLWPIRSNFANLFMINFYKALRSMSIQDAFYKTQKSFFLDHTEFDAPAFWASMFILGNSQQFV